MQCYIHRGLGCTVVGRNAVHVVMYVLNEERIGKLAEIQPIQERAYTLYALAQIRRHRSLAVAYQPVILQLHLHVRGRGTLISGKVECMAQSQFVRFERKIEAP